MNLTTDMEYAFNLPDTYFDTLGMSRRAYYDLFGYDWNDYLTYHGLPIPVVNVSTEVPLIDYSNVQTINGIDVETLQSLGVSYIQQTDTSAHLVPMSCYNIGTVEILQQLQTVNFLLCVLIFFAIILTIVLCYVQITSWFRRVYRSGR